VLDKVVSLIDKVILRRADKFVGNLCRKVGLDKIDTVVEGRLVKESVHGKVNPLTGMVPTRPFPITYRNRLYYLDN
jgi:adenylate/nucleoside-diphosphate kinase